ncbi:MAG: hypothetical protein KatS3mg104_0975 [Phycisphaerae bacterium]|jgi:Spy/CpxP family protein refolding chaperone|nr:MAG: hypothetical protein KatS3mg104_0969 [Phycisphaerae bacterium]GIW75912.1 MAG: hypothetical protein KatS3mg104_0975 [Phycisphaerae bacterium]
MSVNRRIVVGLVGMGLMIGSGITVAEQGPAGSAASDKEKVSSEAGPKLWGVWAKLTSLTPEQKVKMRQIHDNALAEKRKIEQQEEIDLLAVLSDEQKQELQQIKESISAAKKAKEADKAKKSDAPDTKSGE